MIYILNNSKWLVNSISNNLNNKMGRKNKSRRNKGKNNKWKNPPLPPLEDDFK